MAEFYFKWLVNQHGVADRFVITSAATSTEEIGHPVYPPAREILAAHGIGCDGKTAVQMTRQMFDDNDYVIVMDGENLYNAERIISEHGNPKMCKLLDFVADEPTFARRDVADPWYTGDFHKTWNDLVIGCTALLDQIAKDHNLQLS